MNINNFGPFNSAVWGTFSDWIMAIITAITAFYLYKTLKSQNRIFELQRKVTELDQKRYNLQILPDVTIVHDPVSKMVSVTPTNRELNNATFEFKRLSPSVSGYTTIETTGPVTYPEGQPLPFEYQLNDTPVAAPYWLYGIDLKYSDEIGNKYMINITVVYRDGIIKRGPLPVG